MEWIIIFSATIILALIVIAKTYKLLLDNWVFESPLSFGYVPPPMIIEKAYRAVDYRANFEYTTPEYLERFHPPFDYFSTERIVRDKGHLDHIIEDTTRNLTRQMISDGVVEIVDQENESNPYRRRVEIMIKAYKPH